MLILGGDSANAVDLNGSLEPQGESIVSREESGALATLKKCKIMDFFFTDLLKKFFVNIFFYPPIRLYQIMQLEKHGNH